ncbi:MAG: hypothetical protein SV062_10535 [Thermodesulfobacteriota bacterium]|nr:hypothetical protein [Thermodesulfobacteriota bacterium]
MSAAGFAGADKITIYFYSSETNINNFKSLKMEFDIYLAKFGHYELQPFSDREAFEEHIRDKKKCLLLLSSWHYSSIYKRYCLNPVLVGMRNGKKYQKRILVTRDKSANLEIGEVGQIASASSVQHTFSVLNGMLKGKNAADKVRILTVPKDIDALMSVGFGISKSALTTRNSLNKLELVNPILYKKMEILAEGKQALLLILAVPKNFTKDAEKMVDIIKNMSANPDGKRKIQMLGLDGWQKLDPADRSTLES